MLLGWIRGLVSRRLGTLGSVNCDPKITKEVQLCREESTTPRGARRGDHIKSVHRHLCIEIKRKRKAFITSPESRNS